MSRYFETRYTFDPGRERVWRAIAEYLQREVPADSTIVELGSGYADFINQINAKVKIAVDLDSHAAAYCKPPVQFIQASVTALPLSDGSADVIFASNLFEHFSDEDLTRLIGEVRRVLRANGKLILLQPNYYYSFREYWDDYTHRKAFSHHSLSDFLTTSRMKVTRVVPRLLPFSFKSLLPRSYWLTKIYLQLPWRPMAKQMLAVAQRES